MVATELLACLVHGLVPAQPCTGLVHGLVLAGLVPRTMLHYMYHDVPCTILYYVPC